MFCETLTDIVCEVVPSESKTSSNKMLLLSTQTPTTDSNVLHVPVVKHGSMLGISAFAPLLRLMRLSLLTCLGLLRNVLKNQNSDTPLLSTERSRHRRCRPVECDDEGPISVICTKHDQKSTLFLGEQRGQLFPLLHGLIKEQPSSSTE